MAQTELLFLILTGIQAQIPRYIFVAHLTCSIHKIHSVGGLLVKLQNICIIYFRGFVIFCYLIFSFAIDTNYLFFNLLFPYVHHDFCYASLLVDVLSLLISLIIWLLKIIYYLQNVYS